MEQANPLSGRPKRRVIRWICAGLLVAGVISTFVAYRHFTDPGRIRGLAENYLERITGRSVQINSATFSLADGINLRDVSFTTESAQADQSPQPSGPVREVFSCNEISILYNIWALLQGRLEVESFAAIRPTLTLVHDEDHGWDEFSSLMRSLISGKKDTGAAPPIELREARVRLLHHSKTGDRLIEDIHLTVRGRKASEDPRLFNIVWQDANDANAYGHSQIDLTTGQFRNVQGGLPTMSMRGVLLAVDAEFEGADELTQLMGLEGRVRARDYNMMLSSHHEGPRSVTIDLKSAAISIPISEEERGLAISERYLRFNSVNGTVTLTKSSIQADFDGRFHESPCKVFASINGPLKPGITLADVGIEIKATAGALKLPEVDSSPQQRRFIQRWPQLTRFFATYDPHGIIDLDFRVEKAVGEQETFKIKEGTMAVRDGNASCRFFPYRGENITGQVELAPDGLFVRDLCGNHESAEICVNGWMETPTKAAYARFHVAGQKVPVDDALCAALRHQRRWIEEFGLDGAFDADVVIERDRTQPGELPAVFESRVDVQFDDLSAIYVEAPIPVTHLAGRAVVNRGDLEVIHAAGEWANGLIRFHGLAETHEHGLAALKFHLAVDDVRLDDELIGAFPQALQVQAEALRLTSCASATSDITFDPKVGWRHDTLTHLRNMELTPEAFPLTITGAQADLRIGPHGVDVLRARGFYGGAELFAKGEIGKDARDKFDLIVEARDLPVDEEFRDAAPAKLREVLADWWVDEPIDAELKLQKSGPNLKWNGRAQLTNATVYHRAFRHPLHDVDAQIAFDNDHVRSTGARAAFGSAAIDGDFFVALKGDRDGHVRLNTQGIALDSFTRDLLPPTARRAWDDVSPTGRVDLTIDDLSFQQDDASPMTWSVRGQVYPRNVQFGSNQAALISGMIPFEGTIVDGLGGFSLNGQIQNAEAMVYGQPLTGTNARWYVARAAGGQGRAGLDGFRSQFHGGTATSQAQLHFDDRQARYSVSTSIQNAELAPFLEVWRQSSSDDQSANQARSRGASDVRGTMHAQVQFAGTVGSNETRTGGGRVEIRDGYIYKLPIFLAILNVLDITLPNNDVLSEAFGRFFLTGNTVQLTQIEVTGESLSLSGSGTMSISDRSVDLTMFNAGGGRLSGVPVLAELWEGASRELVELRVTGPVSQPQVRARPFRGVTDEFKKLFQKRKPKRNLQTVGS